MKTSLPIVAIRTWTASLASALLCGCGVPVADYEALQKENQELQKVIDQANNQVRQTQAQLQVAQQGLAAAAQLQTRLSEIERLLAEKEQQLKELEARFEKFKADRRNAMIGREYPELRLDEGKLLQKAQITAITGGEVSIRHEAGFIKVALSKSSDELRWQACFDPLEEAADARRRMLAKARVPASTSSSEVRPNTPPASVREAEAQRLRETISQQRIALNNAHAALAARNPSALRGAHWNSAAPETSGLINVFSQRRAVLGLSELDSLAAAIKANLLKVHDLENSGTP